MVMIQNKVEVDKHFADSLINKTIKDKGD